MKSIRRRRHERKTDYKARLTLLKSGKPRLVIRKTNRYFIAQIVESKVAQDHIVLGVTSKQLLGFGWPADKSGSLKNKSSAYLTGYLLGVKAKAKAPEAILDLGMYRNIQKSRLYAVLKGALDAGLKVPHSSEALPEIDEKDKLIATVRAKIK